MRGGGVRKSSSYKIVGLYKGGCMVYINEEAKTEGLESRGRVYCVC